MNKDTVLHLAKTKPVYYIKIKEKIRSKYNRNTFPMGVFFFLPITLTVSFKNLLLLSEL